MIKETTCEQNDEFSTPIIIGSAICCFLLFSFIFFVLYCSKTSNTRVRVLISTCARYFNKLAARWSVSFRRFRYRLLCYVHRSFQLSLWFSCFFFFFLFFFIYSIYCSPPRRFRFHPRTDERTRMQIAFICKTYGITCIHAQWSRSLHAIPLWFVAYVDNDALFANVQALFTLRSQPILRYERPLTYNIVHVSCTYP